MEDTVLVCADDIKTIWPDDEVRRFGRGSVDGIARW